MRTPASAFTLILRSLLLGITWFSSTLIGASPADLWEAIADQPNLTTEEREGARFLSGFLDPSEFSELSPGHRKNLLRYAADHRDGHPKLALCWHHSTKRSIVEAFHAVELAGAHARENSHRPADVGGAFQGSIADHWRTTATGGGSQNIQGQPVTLTWSFVPDGTLIAGGQVTGEPTNDPSNLRAWLAGIYGGSSTGPAASQPWFPIFQAAFDSISSQTGIRYIHEPNDDGSNITNFSTSTGLSGTRGDVRIAGHALDGDFGVLAYNYFPDNADMVIDTSDAFFNSLANNSQRLRNVVEHEHGHGLGLGHVCPLDNTKLMEPYVNLNFTGIQFDEIYTLQRLYGDPSEVHGAEEDNDTLATATPLEVQLNTPFIKEWLGIDDNGDSDHFQFTAPAGSQLTVRVIPSAANYLEGPQNQTTGECTAGTSFDSSTMQDLTVEVIDSNLSTVLAAAASMPAGNSEIIDSLPITRSDTYYLKVNGGSSDFNQLYRLELELTTPAVVILIDSLSLNRELFQGANGVPDPGETVEFNLSLRNVGLVEATNVHASLSLPPGSTGFEASRSYANLGSGSASSNGFIFAPSGDCGDTINLSLLVTADGGYTATLPFELTLGQEGISFEEDFDGSGSLPATWSTTSEGRGGGWSISGSSTHSAPNAAFASSNLQAGSSTLTSETLSIGDNPGTLSFFHHHDTAPGSDGGVLEIQIGSGAWQDIADAGGSFLIGGYNLALGGPKNPLSGRSGWSGDSGNFIESMVSLPDTVILQNIRFRWVLGHDVRRGQTGWYIDEVTYQNFTCDESGIALTLSSTDTSASELIQPADPAEISVSAILPVPSDIPITLLSSGSADPAADLTAFDNLILSSGSASASAFLTAVSDGQIEGPESLQITSPDASGSVDINLIDSPYATWAFTELGSSGPILPFEDIDGDGSPNVEELIFGTDAKSTGSFPSLGLVKNGADFELPVPLGSLPEGVTVDAEASSDLQIWTTDRVTRLPDGFRLSGTESQGYLRLFYSVPEFEP